MFQGQRVALIAVALAVAGQNLGIDLATVDATIGGVQVAELAAQLGAALAHRARDEGRVHVRCDVPVIGDRGLEAAIGVGAQRRRKEAGLALVVEREREPGRIEDGHVLEVNRGILALADLAVVVELELAGAGIPAVVAGHAGGVGGVAQADLVFALEVDPVRFTARFSGALLALERVDLALAGLDVEDARRGEARAEPLVARHLRCLAACEGLVRRGLATGLRHPFHGVGRLLEETDLIFELHAHARPGHHVVALLQSDVTLRLDLVLKRPVGQLVGIEHGADFAQLGVALGGKLALNLAAHAVSAEEDRARRLAALGRRGHAFGRTQGQGRRRIGNINLVATTGRRHERRLRPGRQPGTNARSRTGSHARLRAAWAVRRRARNGGDHHLGAIRHSLRERNRGAEARLGKLHLRLGLGRRSTDLLTRFAELPLGPDEEDVAVALPARDEGPFEAEVLVTDRGDRQDVREGQVIVDVGPRQQAGGIAEAEAGVFGSVPDALPAVAEHVHRLEVRILEGQAVNAFPVALLVVEPLAEAEPVRRFLVGVDLLLGVLAAQVMRVQGQVELPIPLVVGRGRRIPGAAVPGLRRLGRKRCARSGGQRLRPSPGRRDGARFWTHRSRISRRGPGCLCGNSLGRQAQQGRIDTQRRLSRGGRARRRCGAGDRLRLRYNGLRCNGLRLRRRAWWRCRRSARHNRGARRAWNA